MFSAKTLVDVLLIFGPVLGYIVQTANFTATKRTDGYSINVSLILLACNSLRVVYYFGQPYAPALLIQSAVMIAVQLMLVATVIKVRMHNAAAELLPGAGTSAVTHAAVAPPQPAFSMDHMSKAPGVVLSAPSVLSGPIAQSGVVSSAADSVLHNTPRQFLVRYVVLLGVFMLFGALMFPAVPGSAAICGFLSMGIESTLILPQLSLNHKRQSCDGLAPILAFSWIAGDVVKTIYFVVLHQPTPFLVCAAVQLALDAVLVSQMLAYRSSGVGGAAAGAPAATTAGSHAASAHHSRANSTGFSSGLNASDDEDLV